MSCLRGSLITLGLLGLSSITQAQPDLTDAKPLSGAHVFESQAPMDSGYFYLLKRLESLQDPGKVVAATAGAQPQPLTDMMGTSRLAFYHFEEVPMSSNLDTDSDGISDATELANPTTMNPLNPAWSIPNSSGAIILQDRPGFESLSERDDVPGAIGIREVKFLISNVDTPNPRLYLINSTNFPFHYSFYSGALGGSLGLGAWNNVTYFTNNRKFLAGTLLAHDHYALPEGGTGLYTMEFWPSDPVSFPFVEMAYELIKPTLPFTGAALAYHPSGETQRVLYDLEAGQYADSHIRSISSEELYGDTEYTALNLGEAYGRLRVIGPGDTESARDVVIFTSIPNDLSHVAGVITAAPQTPLSHINLKARQNNTPNAYIKDAHTRPDIAALIGEYVHYQITPDGYIIEPATQAEVDLWLDSVRPAVGLVPLSDLSVTSIQPLSSLGHADADSVGSKAANIAELQNILPIANIPDGVAVPFYLYDQYMSLNGFYAEATAMMADTNFQNDADTRKVMLKAFRNRIKDDGVMPTWMMDQLQVMYDSFPAGTTLRCRSSTNNEDLPGFNGAGLYNSYTHHLNEGHIMKSMKQVWSSLWTYRAYEEREFYRIDHLLVYMGVLVHPNFSDEQANGVGVTRNPFSPVWKGYYINSQVGEDLVTNPEANSVPDELLISRLPPVLDYEIQYVRFSNQVPAGQHVLTDAQVIQLAGWMQLIQDHFETIYNPADPAEFAMEIEFKVTQAGLLNIKQARPWVN